MNQEIENLDRVKKRIYYSGFGAELNNEIDMRIEAGETRFIMQQEFESEGKILRCSPEVNIHENKAYYNGFEAILSDPAKPDDPGLRQFFPGYDRITVEEAFMLLIDTKLPRAICKQYLADNNEMYSQWLQIDFNSKTRNGNYVVKRSPDYDLQGKLRDYDFEGLYRNYRAAVAHLKAGKELVLEPKNKEKYDTVLATANPDRQTMTFRSVDGVVLEHDQFRTQEALERIRAEEVKKGVPSLRSSTISFKQDSLPAEPAQDESSGPQHSQDAEETEEPGEVSRKNKNKRTVKPDNKARAAQKR